MEWLSREHAKCSPLREMSPDFVATHPNRGLGVHEAILRSPRAFTVPAIRSWPEYRDEFVSGMDRIWMLEEEAGAVLQRIEARAQKQLDHAAWRRRRRQLS